jgi:hypothetical protein
MQHREWNPKAFFKKISSPVMALFEARFGITLIRDSGKPPSEQTYHAWKALPEAERRALETRLLPVNDMCSTHARPYLDSLAQRIWSSANPHLLQQSMDWSVHDLAMRLFVEAPQELLKTHQGYAVDMMDHFREYRGRYAVELKTSAAAKERMQQSMVEHFRQHAGGAKCQVEDFEGEGKFAIFIYHEDEVTPQDTFDDDGIVVPNWIRPVVRIAAVYYRDTCTLLVKAPRNPEREKLRDLFAEIFVGDQNFFEDLAKSPKFNFAPLADPRFEFATHPADGIVGVCITQVTIQSLHEGIRNITLKLEPNLTLADVRRALLQHGARLHGQFIEGVRLQFEFTQGKGRARFRTVSLFNPGSSNLRDTPRDRIIRRYLKEWRIDENRSAFALAASSVQAAAGR